MAEICQKQSKTPSRTTVEREIEYITEAARRWWPYDVENAKRRLMALMLTEGGGRKRGKKKDPYEEAFGPLHVHYGNALAAARMFLIKTGTKKRYYIDVGKKGGKVWMISALRDDLRFSIMCAGGSLKICDGYANGNKQHGVIIYKAGIAGFMRLLNAKENRNLNELRVWKHFSVTMKWISCLDNQIKKGNDNPCNACFPSYRRGISKGAT